MRAVLIRRRASIPKLLLSSNVVFLLLNMNVKSSGFPLVSIW